MNKLDKATDFM